MEYRQHNQPGCGGCLLLLCLIILVTGGAPALLDFIGVLFYSGLAGVLVLFGLFWAFSFYVQRRVSTYEASQSESHKRFVVLLVNILVKIAQADGHFTKAELRTILNFFQFTLRYNQDQIYWVKQLIKEARESQTDMATLLEEFRTSFAYGLPRRSVYFSYALKATMIPLLTVLGLTFGYLLGGAVVVEYVFDWPGIGGYVVRAITQSDYPAAVGVTLCLAAIYLSINLVVDLLYFMVDPRVQ